MQGKKKSARRRGDVQGGKRVWQLLADSNYSNVLVSLCKTNKDNGGGSACFGLFWFQKSNR